MQGVQKFTGKCNYCKITGHTEAGCRKKAADAKRAGSAAISEDSTGGKTVEAIEEIEHDGDEDDFMCMTCTAPEEDVRATLESDTVVALDSAGSAESEISNFFACTQFNYTAGRQWNALFCFSWDGAKDWSSMARNCDTGVSRNSSLWRKPSTSGCSCPRTNTNSPKTPV